MGFNCLNAAEPLRADNLVLTFEPIQDGGGGGKKVPLPGFPLQVLQT